MIKNQDGAMIPDCEGTKKMICKSFVCFLALFLVQCAAAQSAQVGAAADQTAVISEANFDVAALQIRELKIPEFRALLRARMIGWTGTNDSAARRQASLSLGAEALSDLRDNQSTIGLGVSSYLQGLLTTALRKFGGADAETIIAKFVVKTER